jgi:hypothetical protein
MSDRCVRCGKVLVCDVPFTVELEGKTIKGLQSAPHGCPPEYDHSQFDACEALGINKKELNEIFDGLETAAARTNQ